MKLLIKFSLLISICAVLSNFHVNAQSFILTADSLKKVCIYPWKFHPGDSMEFAEFNHSDIHWMDISCDLSHVIKNSQTFKGIGWYRLNFESDTSISRIPLRLVIEHCGASVIYLDGRLIRSNGIIGDSLSTIGYIPRNDLLIIPSLAPGKHVLAIRYAQFVLNSDYPGLRLWFEDANKSAYNLIQSTIVDSKSLTALEVVYLIFGLLHFFLFLFYREEFSNLHFAGFAISISLVFLLIDISTFASDPFWAYPNEYMYNSLLVISGLSLLHFIYYSFGVTKKISRYIAYFLALLILLSSFLDVEILSHVEVMFVVYVILFCVISTFRSIRKKRKGAWIIGSGIIGAILGFTIMSAPILWMSTLSGATSFEIKDLSMLYWVIISMFLLCVISIPLSISIYQAWVHSDVQRNLSYQSVQVKELTTETVMIKNQKTEAERQRDEIEKQKLIAEEQRSIAEEQRRLLEVKNREILDSIEYAKRIQTAILPPPRVVKEFLKNSFILYLPKDIVAGDFYWMESIEDRIYFAACDCTGHGVPGAMVSVVCNNALHRAVNEFALRLPGEILDKARELVVENFAKSDEDVKDGMDASLCSLDITTRKLFWAGANNPIWIYRASSNIMEEIKADKQPIGKALEPKPFNSHEMDLQEGDCIYLFTDGYADQFGGSNNKKLTRTKFRELLLEIAKLPMNEQRNRLLEHHDTYRGKEEQVDDICIVGVRV